MEEAEVCCQKIGIMAKGSLRCIGSIGRLKDLYGCGYKLTITIDKDVETAEKFISAILPPGSNLLQSFQFSRTYGFLPDANQLAFVFDQLVHFGYANRVSSWGINQTTLDEIFTSVVAEFDAECF
jgi:ABC-type multidrug transport system ATPase subunit